VTTGSWSIGSSSYSTSKLYASKVWAGTDGKYESWLGGTRVKWNSYTMEHRRWSSIIADSNYGVGSITPLSAVSAQALVGWKTNDDLRLLAKLWESIRGHSFDLGINIAEASKTYSSIVQNCRNLGSALISLKHGRIGNAFRYLGVTGRRRSFATKRLSASDVSGRWLEMQYAWMPLVHDSYEASKALAALTGPRSLRFSASVGTKRATYNGTQVPGAFDYLVTVSVSKKILADLYEDTSFARSLGLVDPASIAWEVVPYSFVVDWFIPVGTYLSVWQSIPSLKGRFLSTTRIGQKHSGYRVILPAGNPGYNGTRKTDSWFRIERVPSSSLSVPMPTFNSVPKALSPKRILNAIALTHQALK
jgi:hypothetical protein